MIDYQLIAEANAYYEANNFQRVETPWAVTRAILDITKPPGAKDGFRLIHKNNKGLVASGEQSFLYQYLKGFLPKGKFQTTTPCFRSEDFDEWHTKYFLKTELIQTVDVNEDSLHKMTNTALGFFIKQFSNSAGIELVKTETGYDIMAGKIELGSYGIRQCSFLSWIYGTGVAEPRTSAAKKYYNV